MEQIRARAMEIAMPHNLTTSPVHLVGSPLKLSETPVTYRHAPPTAGQHSENVLRDLLKMPQSALDELKAKGVIA
jgi:crotonobetainyl-CoA:carnitine CoA-transferase CaiB-like acyl-CoA transferase